MESDPVANDENKVDLRRPSSLLKLSRSPFTFHPFQIYSQTLSVAQTPVALVFCILNLHLCSTEKISGLAKLWGLWSTNHLYWMSRLVSVPIPIISWHLAGSLSPYLNKDLSRGWGLQYFWSKPKVTGGLGRRRSRAVLGELEGRWVALLLSILGGVRVRVTWYMSALLIYFGFSDIFETRKVLRRR